MNHSIRSPTTDSPHCVNRYISSFHHSKEEIVNRHHQNAVVSRSSNADNSSNYPSVTPARISNELALAELANDATAKLTSQSIGNHTVLCELAEVANKICPAAAEGNSQMTKVYGYTCVCAINDFGTRFFK